MLKTLAKSAKTHFSDERNKIQTHKRFKRTQTHNLHIFGVIPAVRLHNDTYTTVKRLKTMKNDMKSEITCLFLFVIPFFQALNRKITPQRSFNHESGALTTELSPLPKHPV